MVNTRQNQSSQDIDEDMPVKDSNATESSSLNNREEDADMNNESDYHPRTRDGYGMSRRRELRTRCPTPSYRTLGRVSRHPTRTCRRVIRLGYDDEIDESDNMYNIDDDDDDDDEPIFTVKKKYSPVRTVRRFSRRISRDERRGMPRSSLEERSGNEVAEEKVLENGIKVEDDNDQDGEGEGLRRSKRQRKLLYGSFNQSWIMDSQRWEIPESHLFKGYPNPYQNQENGENEGVSSNDEAREEEVPAAEENDAKPAQIVNNEDDVYTKIKRTRRRRIRYSPSNEISVKSRLRERRPRPRVPESSASEESQVSSDEGVVTRRKRTLRRDDSSDEFTRRGQSDTGRVYHLRRNKPAVERFQATSNSSRQPRRSSRLVLCSVRRSRYQSKPRDSSSSDEERFQRKKAKSLAKARSRCMPLNYKPSDPNQLQKTPVHSSKPSGGAVGPKGPADVDPMAVDTSVRFDKVGGLEGHIRCLKEMVVFPMMYREIFEKFQIQPPKGVLFHGPPGTGKTLIARALANECSQGDRKVAFFMRKGADCLSKWVGESERQLRLLFEQAYQMRPSIIFFDEIDGLAPVRSSKQDQIHASIVSTLLALLDGLDDRGEIIVIGATNRIDAIDPALRRPGRFDRELYFPLPGRKEREEILAIHTKPWANPPSQELISYLAEKSVGYCGSDLRLLCSEAVVHALRRRYPQIYKSSQKLLLQADAVNVEEEDFKLAQNKIIPASSRVNPCPRARLSKIVAPLLQAQFDKAVSTIREVFPQASLQSRNETSFKPVYRPHFIICGADETYGQTSHLAPALLEFMEHIPVHIINLSTLFEMSNRNPEEAIIQIVREAVRNPPSIIYLPCIDKWWELLPFTAQEIFLDRIQTIPVSSPVFILATSHCSYCLLNSQLKAVFKYEIFEMEKPNKEERMNFFKPLFMEEAVRHPEPPELKEEDWEELPVAPPPPPPPPNKLELEELHNLEEHKLRELRIFLRDICAKLARNRQFFIFTKPVDVKEVPDYLSIIKQPMDLETMMTNIDLHRYNSAQEFLSDIDLIVRNALEYNPAKDPEDKLIRHRACSLRDTAYTLIKAEMDTDFEEECRKISKKRRETNDEGKMKTDQNGEASRSNNAEPSTSSNPLEPYIITSDSKPSTSAENNQSKRRDSLKSRSSSLKSYLDSTDRIRKRKRMGWARGFLKKGVKRVKRAQDSGTGENDQKSSLTSSFDNSESNTQDTVLESSQKSAERNSTGKNNVQSTPEKDSAKKNKSVSSASPQNQTSKTPPSTPNKSQTGDETPLKSPKKRRTARQRKLDKELADEPDEIVIDREALNELWKDITEKTNDCSLDTLLDLHSMLNKIIYKYRDIWDRQELLKNLEEELKKIKELNLIPLKTDRCSEAQELLSN